MRISSLSPLGPHKVAQTSVGPGLQSRSFTFKEGKSLGRALSRPVARVSSATSGSWLPPPGLHDQDLEDRAAIEWLDHLQLLDGITPAHSPLVTSSILANDARTMEQHRHEQCRTSF